MQQVSNRLAFSEMWVVTHDVYLIIISWDILYRVPRNIGTKPNGGDSGSRGDGLDSNSISLCYYLLISRQFTILLYLSVTFCKPSCYFLQFFL